MRNDTETRQNGEAAGHVLIRRHGLDISDYDPVYAGRTLERRLAAAGSPTVSRYLDHLDRDRAEAEAFHHSLRIGYSAFFRDPLAFALIERRLLPELLGRNPREGRAGLRVWSAGCAAGQEAWSVAILLDESCDKTSRHPSWRVFATDADEPDLAFAHAGVYSADELGNVPLRHVAGCFSPQGERYAVAENLREHVEFAVYDLLDATTSAPPSSIFGDFDLILCCNVLFYYRTEQQRRIIGKLLGCLSPGGYLVTGETERHLVTDVGGLDEPFPGTPVFRRRKGR